MLMLLTTVINTDARGIDVIAAYARVCRAGMHVNHTSTLEYRVDEGV